MLSRIATHEPLPFVPPTVITLYGGGTSSSRSRTVRIRPRLMSIFFGWSVSNHASHSAREAKRCGTGESALGASGGVGRSRRFRRRRRQRRRSRLDRLLVRLRQIHELRDHGGDLVTRPPPIDDHVDRALLEQELGALEADRQSLLHGLLDHARAGETDQRAGL